MMGTVPVEAICGFTAAVKYMFGPTGIGSWIGSAEAAGAASPARASAASVGTSARKRAVMSDSFGAAEEQKGCKRAWVVVLRDESGFLPRITSADRKRLLT